MKERKKKKGEEKRNLQQSTIQETLDAKLLDEQLSLQYWTI